MSESQVPKRLWRSVGSVTAGIVVIFATSIGTDVVLHASGVFPAWFEPMAAHLWGVALAYRIVYGVVGAYITALIAPNRPLWHAMVLGGIGIGLTTVGVAVNWNKGPEFGPIWFNLGLIAISLPCSWAGGRLRESKLATE